MSVPPKAPEPPVEYMCKLTQRERVFHHSLSNAAFIVAIVLWLAAGWYFYHSHKRAAITRKAQDALVQAVVGSGQIVVVCDERGIITSCSQTASSMFHTELVGRHIHSFCPPDVQGRDNGAFERALTDIRQSSKPAVYSIPHIIAGEGKTPVFEGSITVRVVPESDDGLLIVAVFTPQNVIKSLPEHGLSH